MSRALTIVTAILTILHPYVSAEPPCLPGYEWSFNSLGQSPCNMTEALGGVCINGPFTLNPLRPGYVYYGPSPDTANSCRCSTVFYSLMSACANCQNESFLYWSDYNVNCTKVYSQIFLNPIPPGTKIPHYAYLDVATDDTFNVLAAENAGGPESTPASQPTGTSATSITTSTTTSSSKKVNIGAIVGGVVGGVAVIGIAAGLIAFRVMRRRKSSVSIPSTYNAYPSPQTTMSEMKYDATVPTMPSGQIYEPHLDDLPTFPNPYSPQVTSTIAGNAKILGGTPVPIRNTQYTGTGALELRY